MSIAHGQQREDLQAGKCQPEKSAPLDLHRAFRLSYNNNPEILQARAMIEASDARKGQALAAFLPRLDFQAGFSYSNNPVSVFGTKLNQSDFEMQDFRLNALNDPDYREDYMTRFILTQPLFNSGEEYSQYRKASIIKDISGLNLKKNIQDTLYRVEQAYCRALLSRERIEVLESVLKAARAHEDLARRRFDAGLALKSDLLSAKVRRFSVERELIEAKNKLVLAIASLNQTMGIDLDTQWELQDLPWTKQDQGTLEWWIEKAMNNRPELLVARENEELAEVERSRAMLRFLPAINLHGIYENHRNNIAHNGGESWTFAATLDFNIFKGFSDYYAARAARAELSGKQSSTVEAESRIKLQVKKAYLDFITAQKQVQVAQLSLEQAEESQKILKKRYENGLALMVELLSANSAVKEENINLIQARFNARLAWAELNYRSGYIGKGLPFTVAVHRKSGDLIH